MNMHPGHDEPDLPADEWRVQEQALRAERLGLSDHPGDARLHAYRTVARALRQPLPDPLPADFAEQLAGEVARTPGMRERFERLTGTSLLVVLLVSGIGCSLAFSGIRWQALVDWAPMQALASPWLACLGLCAGLTALLQSHAVWLPHDRRNAR